MDLLKENIRLLRSSQTSKMTADGDNSDTQSRNLYPNEYCGTMKCIIEPLILFTGLVSNLILMIVIVRNRRTDGLISDKPMRYLLIAILLSDIWFLMDTINVWYFSMQNKPDLSSYSGACQIYTYMEYLFSTSIEFYMISADFILLNLVRKSKKRASTHADEIYTENLIENGCGNPDSTFEVDLVTPRNKSRKSLVKSERFSMYSMQENNQIQVARLGSSFSRQSNDDSMGDQKLVCNRNQSHFVRMIQSHTSRFKNESIYLNIVFREKVIIILCTFLCVYLLSFLLWIRGNVLDQTAKSPTINIKQDIETVLQGLTSDSYALPISNKSTTTSVFHSKKSTLIDLSGEWSDRLESLELSLVPVCLTYEFAVPLIRIFISMTSILRLFTLLINIFTSIYFLFTFRTEYLYTMRNMLKGNRVMLADTDSNYNDDSTGGSDSSEKSIKLFNNLSLVYSTNEPFTVELEETESSSSTKAHHSTAGGGVGLVSAEQKTMTRARKYYRSHFAHFHFVRHYAIMTLIYSLLIAPSVLHDNRKLAIKIGESLLSVSNVTEKKPNIDSVLSVVKNTYTLLSESKKKNESILIFPIDNTIEYDDTTTLTSSPRLPELKNKKFNAIKKSDDLLALETINIFEHGNSDSEFYENFLHMTKCLAHSTKLLTYILFSVHLKLNFKCRKNNYGEANLL